MCGIFGLVSNDTVNKNDLNILLKHAQQRGRDSSGLIYYNKEKYCVNRADYNIKKLIKKIHPLSSKVVLGHSRLITNGLSDNQPVIRGDICVLHNGIIVNDDDVWNKIDSIRYQKIDTEVIAAITENHLVQGKNLNTLPGKILSLCKGTIASAIILPRLGKLVLFSNNGSLYIGKKDKCSYFSSEEYPLIKSRCKEIKQLIGEDYYIIDIPASLDHIQIKDDNIRNENLIPQLGQIKSEESLLIHNTPKIKRCTCCILPETMPFITFDESGVCNYCRTYKMRNKPRPKEELFNLVEPYRRKYGSDCILPFSGGRDSCYGLHLVVKELKMKPITYTYDWGMVTDLGRRNVSRMCANLGIENIIVADDISKKRRNIALNLAAWLKSPHLGMISILTAGDKHFFRHIETIKKQTGISLNIWSVNPLEVTHFKAGFLGTPPYFEETRVYTHGVMKQIRYQKLRFKAMLKSPGYFNSSLWDTLSGEYYRSFASKNDYYHLYDYWHWDEQLINDVLLNEYDWERAPDTNTTWRIGDGTAAFYNYIYYTVAGFTEHDTFRSNQIREGEITRQYALELVEDENQPRYPNIRWYLDSINFDFSETIKIINAIPRLY